MEVGLPQGRQLLGIKFNGWRVVHRRLIAQRRNHISPVKTSCRPIRAMARTTIIDIVVINPSLSLVTRKSS